MQLTENNHSEFIGLEALKEAQAKQLKQLEEWALNNDWQKFHVSHFDWWMFPFSKPSHFGYTYTVYESEIQALKQDPDFIKNYLRGVELVLLSWGWDLYNEEMVTEPGLNQEWHNWPIRLYKCGMSLQEFEFDREFNSVRKYANLILKQCKTFEYMGIDLAIIFR